MRSLESTGTAKVLVVEGTPNTRGSAHFPGRARAVSGRWRGEVERERTDAGVRATAEGGSTAA